MQTARGTAASITQSCDQEVDLVGCGRQGVGGSRGAGVSLGVERRHGAAVPSFEKRGRLPQHLYRVEFTVLQDSNGLAVDAVKGERFRSEGVTYSRFLRI